MLFCGKSHMSDPPIGLHNPQEHGFLPKIFCKRLAPNFAFSTEISLHKCALRVQLWNAWIPHWRLKGLPPAVLLNFPMFVVTHFHAFLNFTFCDRRQNEIRWGDVLWRVGFYTCAEKGKKKTQAWNLCFTN